MWGEHSKDALCMRFVHMSLCSPVVQEIPWLQVLLGCQPDGNPVTERSRWAEAIRCEVQMLLLTVVLHIYLRRCIMFNHKPDLLFLLSDLSHHDVPEMKKGKLLLNLFLSLTLPFSRDYSYVYLQCSNQYIIFLYTDRRSIRGQSVWMSRVSLRPWWSDVPLRVKTSVQKRLDKTHYTFALIRC